MANITLTAKIALVNKTTEEWASESTVPFKSCPCVEFTTDGKTKLKIGDGVKTFTDLPYGTYYIKQLSAPEGYYINDEVFEIVIDENFQGVGDIHNMAIEVAPVPVDTGVRTGDNADLAGLALLMVGACAGAYISRKRKHTA